MIRLWHPMRDPYHCSFRLLTLLRSAKENSLPLAKISFLDLYLLFPEYLHELRLPNHVAELRRSLRIRRPRDSYIHLPDIRLVYRELQRYQRVAIDRLVAKALLSKEEYDRSYATLIQDVLPAELESHIAQRTHEYGELLLLLWKIAELPMDGPNSLLRQNRLELGGRLN